MSDVIVTVAAPTAADTAALGAALAGLLQPGDVILLGGELGAGKTTLTKGLAAALGVTEEVTSPTFTLVRNYRTAGGWDLLHADVWRLEQLQEVIDLGLPEQLEEGAAAVIEWGERAAPALVPQYLLVDIDYGETGSEVGHAGGTRQLSLRAVGAAWSGRTEAVRAAVAAVGKAA